jgi:[DsrC]-trisulfide reductase subunit P
MTTSTTSFLTYRASTPKFWLLAALGALVSAVGFIAALYMEHKGHIVTGMNQQIVWGLPHVFAIFLIVSCSGVLNVASIGSVFGKTAYKRRAALSGLLSIAMLAGGLFVLMLDLGRADRVIIAATTYNFSSIFAWNVFLYSGMFAVVAVYLWVSMEKRMYGWVKPVGVAAFVWRLILTTGTGSIFGFLLSRSAYQSAIIAPMFIIMSFAWGLAVFLIVQEVMFRWNQLEVHPAIQKRMKNLLGVFLAAVFYFVVVYHLTNIYYAKQTAFERFILLDGGIYTLLFWVGWFLVGTVVPMAMIYGSNQPSRNSIFVASLLVVVGAFCQLYVFIIGGEAFPIDIFPGWQITSTFSDGQIATYTPKLPEFLLGMGGIGVAFMITLIAVRVLKFLPEDDPVQPDAAHD